MILDVLIADPPMNFSIPFGYSTAKLSKLVTQLLNEYKAAQWVPGPEYLSRFFTYAPSFILLGRLSLK